MKASSALAGPVPHLGRHCLTVIAIVLAAASSRAASPLDRIWVTDGEVRAIAVMGTTAFIGGGFSWAGPCTGWGITLDRTTGEIRKPYSKVNWSVYAVVPDGLGGWFIGGAFDHVGDR